MSKRHLSDQQKQRIRHQQHRRAARALETSGDATGDTLHGLVISHFGKQLDVESQDGTTHRCHFRANLGQLVTGDEVVFRTGEPVGVVEAALPRRSLLERPDAFGRLRPIAANVDLIGIVIAPEPSPHGNLIDRYLVAAEACGMEPCLILNKTDLATETLLPLLEGYQQLGYRTLLASTRSREGLDGLKALLDRRNSVLVGQSGVGKSSLIKALLPDEDIRIGELSRGEVKGTHTTTTARLFHLPSGGNLIDSPGIREFGVEHLGESAIIAGFREFHPYLGHCRFRDCRHRQEPGCALQTAVEQGAISPARLASFRQMLNDGGQALEQGL